MKKIISSILSIVLTISVVSGAAYAAFTDDAQIQGLSITTGNPDLRIYNPTTELYADNVNFGASLGTLFNRMYPGQERSFTLLLNNNTDSAISLSTFGKLTAATGWGPISDVIEVKVSDGVTDTDWKSLTLWNSTGFAFPGTMAQGAEKSYTFSVRIAAGTPNTFAGQSLSDIVFTLTGSTI